MTLIITGMINTFHNKNNIGQNATNGYFRGHLNVTYFFDKLEDLQSDFMTKMFTNVTVMCFTETYLVQGACIDQLTAF